MADQVALDDPGVLNSLARNVALLRTHLERVGQIQHGVVDIFGPDAGAMPAGLRPAVIEVWDAAERAIDRLTVLCSGADRSLAALVYQVGWIATNFPQMDQVNETTMTRLIVDSDAAIPPPSDRSAADPRFASPTEPH